MTSELLSQYSKATIEFIDLANSLSKEELETPSTTGEWSRAFIVHHMSDGDIHFAARYWHVLTVEKPLLANFDEDLYPDNLNYAGRDPFASLAAIEGIFQVNLDVLSHIAPEKWDRVGVHESMGELTLSQILNYGLEHRLGHLNQFKQFS